MQEEAEAKEEAEAEEEVEDEVEVDEDNVKAQSHYTCWHAQVTLSARSSSISSCVLSPLE